MKRTSCWPAFCTLVFLLLGSWVASAAAPLPQVKVTNLRRAFHNGEHNAFTDLIRFQNRFYLTFRSCPDGHGVNPTSSIIVLASDDLKQWQPVHRFSVAKRDTRDPHFLIFKDRLFVYTGAWYCGDTAPKSYDLNQHLGFGVWTADGTKWTEPEMLEGTYGHYVWRAASFGGKAYLCGRRKHRFVETASRQERDPLVESALLVSDDGLVWQTAGRFQETYGDETAFLFEAGGGRNAQICRSKPPYQQWERQDLDRYIGGPLLARWGERLVVGGRRTISGPPKTSLCWLVNDTLHEFAELPSGGDNSYPGFIELSPTRAVVSWYSSHERDRAGKTITAIYLADLELVR
jgi:hypothetical protein